MESNYCKSKYFSYQCDQCDNYLICSHQKEEQDIVPYDGHPAEEYYEEIIYPKFDW